MTPETVPAHRAETEHLLGYSGDAGPPDYAVVLQQLVNQMSHLNTGINVLQASQAKMREILTHQTIAQIPTVEPLRKEWSTGTMPVAELGTP